MLSRLCAPLLRICKKQEKKKKRRQNKEKKEAENEELKKNTYALYYLKLTFLNKYDFRSNTIFGYTEPGAGKKKFEC